MPLTLGFDDFDPSVPFSLPPVPVPVSGYSVPGTGYFFHHQPFVTTITDSRCTTRENRS